MRHDEGVSAAEEEWVHFERLGLKAMALRTLTERLQADLSPDFWGYLQLADLDDVEQRAVVSDQLASAVSAIAANLVESGYHLRDFDAIAGPGIRMPRPECWTDDHEQHVRADMAVAGFFRGVGSALDCLAAVAIVVLRIPASPQYADVADLTRLPVTVEKCSDLPPEQLGAWRDMIGLIDERNTAGLAWALQARNLVVHRGRHVAMSFPRPNPTSLIVVANNPRDIAQRRSRSDLYFRRWPWLPEAEHIASSDTLGEQVLNEPASLTMAGIKTDLVELVEAVCGLLHRVWAELGETGKLRAPGSKWVLRPPPSIDFRGYAAHAQLPDQTELIMNSQTARRMMLGEHIRRRRRKMPG